MIICAFENSPSIPSFLVTKIVYIGYGQLKKMAPFPFTSPLLCSLYFYILLLLMPVSGSVLLLYAGAHKISLKYLFQEGRQYKRGSDITILFTNIDFYFFTAIK
jgi:hypothetical protein